MRGNHCLVIHNFLSMRILIVDDDLNIREVFKSKCKKHGIEFDEADTGDEALQKIASNQYDAVLLDLLIPGKDGIAVLYSMKKDSKLEKTKVFVLTNMGGKSSIQKALDHGAYKAFIKANMGINDLIKIIVDNAEPQLEPKLDAESMRAKASAA